MFLMRRLCSFSPLRAFAVASIFFVAAILISSCAAPIAPPCPPVRVDSATATLVKFKDGGGRDLSNVEYQVEMVGFHGECIFLEDTVEVILDVDFRVTSASAAQAGPISFYYFAAIPQFFPQAVGKRIFEIQTNLPGGASAPISLTESEVTIEIPISDDRPAAAFDVYLGLQLNDDQLDFNRQRMNSRP